MPKSNQRKRSKNLHTLRRRAYYAKKKAELVQLLGGCCKKCGSIVDLTFDHINGRDWDIRAVHSTKRIAIYRREYEEGKLQLLCLSCNSAKGDQRVSDEPF